MIERMEKRLASWKGKLLSIGGRLTLIKSTLSNLAVYYLSLFPIPKGVADKIVKLQRDFFWAEDHRDKKSWCLVKWEVIEMPKKMWGMSSLKTLGCYLSGFGDSWRKTTLCGGR